MVVSGLIGLGRRLADALFARLAEDGEAVRRLVIITGSSTDERQRILR